MEKREGNLGMERVKYASDLGGKTISRAAINDCHCLFIFDDDTYFVCDAIRRGHGAVIAENTYLNLEPSVDNYEELFGLGVISRKARDKFEKQKINLIKDMI